MFQGYFMKIGLICCLIAAILSGCGTVNSSNPAKQADLLVSAAASLQDSMKEVAEAYAKKHPNVKLTFNFGSSGALQQQIEQGAPADLFLSAGAKQMAALIDKGFVDSGQQSVLLSNSLVVIVPADSKKEIAAMEDLGKAEVTKIAMGEVDTVPAGTYAKEALSHYKLWDSIQPKLIFTKDVRQVLSYVESGNVDAGIVYSTDVLNSNKARVALKAESGSHKPIQYPAGIVKASKQPSEAAEFYKYLQGEEASAIFAKFGFMKP